MLRLAALPIALLTIAAAGAAPAGAKTYGWLCHPGMKADPCRGDLTASVVDPAGNVVRTERTTVPTSHRIDCFYVYPTVSSQDTTNANLNIDPEQIAIAQQQAQRFSRRCRVYAPVYRQFTVPALLKQSTVTAKTRALAYNGVRDAWRAYLRNDNKGRGVVLIGHSQGTFVLRELIAREIDNRPAVRRRVVSALLLGGNVRVLKGKGIGGDFKHIPACRRAAQTGCVVAYSMFDAIPPKDARFGRVTSGFGAITKPSVAKRYEVLCTNPAALGGGSGRLQPYARSEPFPGLLGIAVNAFIGPLPDVPTGWIVPPGSYTAHCSHTGGASYLAVKASDGARDFEPSPDAGWGWHLGDVSLAWGNLIGIVGRQATAYLARH